MSYKNRHNHSGRWRKNRKTHNLICDILIRLDQFKPNLVDIIRMFR